MANQGEAQHLQGQRPRFELSGSAEPFNMNTSNTGNSQQLIQLRNTYSRNVIIPSFHTNQLAELNSQAVTLHQPFRPSFMKTPAIQAFRENPTQDEIARRILYGCSPSYRGDPSIPGNRPANIPPEQNCSVWPSGLPADISTSELLGAIRNVGKIWASVISLPTGVYRTSAAKVTFFTAVAAQTFLSRYGDGDSLLIRGHAAQVRPDRNRVAQPPAPEGHSRVLWICGPKKIVNVEFLTTFFSSIFDYQIDEVIPVITGNVINMLLWRFGSYRCQAKWGYEALQRAPFFRENNMSVSFGRDPCDI
ncbi:hypothetical protein VTK26DRAFT_88 [Humicola hyalothermophila]